MIMQNDPNFFAHGLYGSKKEKRKDKRNVFIHLQISRIIRSIRDTPFNSYWILYNLNRDPLNQSAESITNVSFAPGLNFFIWFTHDL